MNHRTRQKLLVLGLLLGLTAAAQASLAGKASVSDKAQALAQAAPPAPAASAPSAEAQPDNRDVPARPAARRRGVGVVISMNLA